MRQEDANTKVQERKYFVMKYGNFDDNAKHYIHLGDTDMESSGFDAGPRWVSETLPDGKKAKLPLGIRKRDGIADHYHFRACWQLDLGCVMARRFPCGCTSCIDTLSRKPQQGRAASIPQATQL